MKRTLLYLLAITLLPQIVSGAVLVGKTEGNFSVSPTGAATYTIPIKLQNGMNDFVPSISLTYSSQAGNGIAGIGWNISGLSTISIVPRNIYFDGRAECIYTGEDNAFALDGMRLLLTDSINGQTGATYRTENEQYSIIRITASSNGTPATFQVKTTDGSTYKYGSSSGRLTLSNGEAYQWALDYAEDVLGNYIQYTYAQEGILYPTSIAYGRNTHGTAGVNCTVLFNYEDRPDSVPAYLHGELNYLKKRLKSVVCKYGGNTYRTYTLNYTTDVFSHLTSVTESGTSSSSLPPTTFEWEIPMEFQLDCSGRTMETSSQENPNDESFFSGDLDGDGISEIISMETKDTVIGSTHWPYVAFKGRKWNPETERYDSCYGAKTTAGFEVTDIFSTLKSCGLVMHANCTKRNSLVYPFCRVFDGIKAMIFNFPIENLNLHIPMKGLSSGDDFFPPYTIFDADRNGLDDIFIIEKEKYSGTYPAYLVSFDLITRTVNCIELSLDIQGVPDKIRCADFNSDGMPDLLITTTGGYYIYWNREGNFSDADRYYGTAFGASNVLETGDFNGDGLVDLIINTSGSNWCIARNTGNATNGYFALSGVYELIFLGAQLYTGKAKKLYCFVQDIDGDGKSDAIVGYPHSSGDGGCICILKLTDNTLMISSFHHLTNSGQYPDIAHIVLGNFEGHSGVEIMYYGKALEQNTTGWHMLKNPTAKVSSHKIVSITDGLGARDSISYGLLTDGDVYSITNHHIFPLYPMASAIPVVKTRTETIPTDCRTTNYLYANGFVHLQGKGFLGFEDIRAASSTGIVTETHCRLDSTFYVLLPQTVTQSNASGTTITRDVSTINLQNLGAHAYTINDNTHHETQKPLDGFGESEDCENFEYGFPTVQRTEDDMFITVKEITHWESPIDSIWIKGLPEEVEITKTGYSITGDDVYESITYERAPTTGLILKETRRREGQIVSTDGYTYNEYGQVTQHYTVPFNSTDTLVTTYEYDTGGRLKKEYDPKGLYRTYTYSSSYGTLSAIRDFDGVTTQYTYDGLFRETKRRTAIETCQTTRALSDYGGSVYSIKETVTGEAPVTAYYDAWERKVAESAPLANNQLMYTDYQYLSNGKVGFVSFPHKKTEPTDEGTTYTYDTTHRLVSTVDSNGKTSTWEYAPTMVTSCIDGVETTTYYYTPDKKSWVEDAAGCVAYEYNADGNIYTIVGEESDAYYDYDTFGRLIQTTDMNGVTKQYSYDVNGHPYRTTIAGSYVETNYDKYGILRSKSWADPGESPHTVTYTYDSKFCLTGETGEGYTNSYTYDSYGRMTHKHNSVTDNQTKSVDVSFQYASGRQISRKTVSFYGCQTTITENFSYHNGYKTQETLNDSLVWQLVKQDRWGHVTEDRDFLGTTTHSYDDYGNMLSMNRSGHYPINESYTYNILTGNMSSKNNVSLSYDSMNQLTGWGEQTFSYDDLGNITCQPYVGNFTYDGYRITDMSADSSYVIDDSLHISYYKAIERPKSIENEHYKANFYYDGNGDRIKMEVYKKVSGQYRHYLTRYYLDANAEITVNQANVHSYLYYAGGDTYTAPAVMEIHEFTGPSLYHISRDNLGSVLLYENSNGTHYQYSYSPWGVRTYLTGDTIHFSLPGEEPLIDPFYRTYTGHEDLWMFGLLNANARLYSPYLGRFISPDPLLNEDGGPLDYNPYIYARNNPYRYIDRNGEFWWLAAAAIWGGFGNVFVNFDNINCAGDFFGYFGVGAAASALGVCVGGGVNAFIAGGSFWAGFTGTTGLSATGFWAGAATGAARGFAGGFVASAGNSWLNGSSFGDGFLCGLKGGAIDAIIEGVLGGLEGGLDAVSKHTNFFTGIGKFDATGAYSTTISSTGEVTEMKLEGEVHARYVRDFEEVHVYETKELGVCAEGHSYSAYADPKYGIITGVGVCDKRIDMMQHEFGHILQYRKYGANAYKNIIVPESQNSFRRAINQGNMSLHYNFWTETYANYLSKVYFGGKWLGGPGTIFPAAYISLINEMKLRSFKNW